MTFRLDFKHIKSEAEGQWGWLIAQLAPSLEPAVASNGKHVACPVHGGNNNDAFRVFKDFEETGGVICNTCGAKSDGIETLNWVNGWTSKQSFEAMANALGIDDSETIAPRVKHKTKEATQEELDKQKAANDKRLASLKKTWDEGLKTTDKKAATFFSYMANRGLGRPRPALDLRLHPSLPYYNISDGRPTKIGDFPAILAMFRDINGEPLTLHRTYLSKEGTKAQIDYPVKKFMASSSAEEKLTGGAIYLDPPAPRVVVAEGLETALAVRQATQLPTHACCSATLLAAYKPAEIVNEVLIFADLDDSQAGHFAAQTLAERLMKEGIEVYVFYPPGPIEEKSVDWLDAFAKLGHAAFPNYVQPPVEQTAYSITDSDIPPEGILESCYGIKASEE